MRFAGGTSFLTIVLLGACGFLMPRTQVPHTQVPRTQVPCTEEIPCAQSVSCESVADSVFEYLSTTTLCICHEPCGSAWEKISQARYALLHAQSHVQNPQEQQIIKDFFTQLDETEARLVAQAKLCRAPRVTPCDTRDSAPVKSGRFYDLAVSHKLSTDQLAAQQLIAQQLVAQKLTAQQLDVQGDLVAQQHTTSKNLHVTHDATIGSVDIGDLCVRGPAIVDSIDADQASLGSLVVSDNAQFSKAVINDEAFVKKLDVEQAKVTSSLWSGYYGNMHACMISGMHPQMHGLMGQSHKYISHDAQIGDMFGFSCSISPDGTYAVIGAPLAEVNKNAQQGAAYIFWRNPGDGAWIQRAKIVAPDGGSFDDFGSSVSCSHAGSYVVVGAAYATYRSAQGEKFRQGAAYIFVRDGDVWKLQSKLLASDGAAYDCAGSAVNVSADGSCVVVGASNASIDSVERCGAAYVFLRNGAVWHECAKLCAHDALPGAAFGSALSSSADGLRLLIGAPLPEGQGAVYYFVHDGLRYQEQIKLYAQHGVIGDQFGCALAQSADGSSVIIGACGACNGKGAAYSFIYSGTTYCEQQQLPTPDDGTLEGPASDGAALDSAPDSAASDDGTLEGAGGDQFGFSVSLSADGSSAVIGSPSHEIAGYCQGAVYVYAHLEDGWRLQQKVHASDGVQGMRYGFSVGITSEGLSAIVGAPYDPKGCLYTLDTQAMVVSKALLVTASTTQPTVYVDARGTGTGLLVTTQSTAQSPAAVFESITRYPTVIMRGGEMTGSTPLQLRNVHTGGLYTLRIDEQGNVFSDGPHRYYKKIIGPLDDDSALIYELTPVKFVHKNESDELRYGFLPEDVYRVLPSAVLVNEQGHPKVVAYEGIVALVVKQMQQHQQLLQEYGEKLKECDRRLGEQQQMITKLLAEIHQQRCVINEQSFLLKSIPS